MAALPAEVAILFVTARVEKRGELSGYSVPSRDIRPLESVTVKAAESEVSGHSQAVMLFGNDVVNLKSILVKLLKYPAIFAATPCPLPDLSHQCRIHDLIL